MVTREPREVPRYAGLGMGLQAELEVKVLRKSKTSEVTAAYRAGKGKC